jgi:hypothetical protein
VTRVLYFCSHADSPPAEQDGGGAGFLLVSSVCYSVFIA